METAVETNSAAPQNNAAKDTGSEPGPMVALSDKAAAMVKETMEREGNKFAGLRIAVVGGGCSGFQYSLDLDEEGAKDGDSTFLSSGIQCFVDPMSSMYLMGVEIDPVRPGRLLVQEPGGQEYVWLRLELQRLGPDRWHRNDWGPNHLRKHKRAPAAMRSARSASHAFALLPRGLVGPLLAPVRARLLPIGAPLRLGVALGLAIGADRLRVRVHLRFVRLHRRRIAARLIAPQLPRILPPLRLVLPLRAPVGPHRLRVRAILRAIRLHLRLVVLHLRTVRARRRAQQRSSENSSSKQTSHGHLRFWEGESLPLHPRPGLCGNR